MDLDRSITVTVLCSTNSCSHWSTPYSIYMQTCRLLAIIVVHTVDIVIHVHTVSTCIHMLFYVAVWTCSGASSHIVTSGSGSVEVDASQISGSGSVDVDGTIGSGEDVKWIFVGGVTFVLVLCLVMVAVYMCVCRSVGYYEWLRVIFHVPVTTLADQIQRFPD